jgi:glucosamine--fructose-6-phosphate aminotransferase (isomerizing)
LDTIRQLKEDSATKSLLETWAKKTTIFILGKRQQEAIAREGALKIKEVAYLHAEGYSSSALKHGAFALIEPGLPIILLDIDEEYAEKHENVYQEVAGRGADVLLIQKMGEKNSDPMKKTWTVPKNQTFGGVLANIYLQWISYEIAVIRQLSPDYPRNLAKVVTVE